MVIPVPANPWAEIDPDGAWATLSPEAKRERVMCVGWRLFSEQGLDAPMPTVAAMAGAGVGSLYRQFPSKHDLLAAIVIRRLEEIHAETLVAIAQPGSRWQALQDMLWRIVERQHGDQILGEAWQLVSAHEGVAATTTTVQETLERLLAAARAEGGLRADAQTDDIRLLFAATRATKNISADAWKRTLELLIDGLAAR